MIVPKAPRFALLIALLSLFATGESEKVDVSIHFLTELNIVELTIEVDSFSDWVKPVIAAVESQFKDESASRTVIVQVTLHRDRPADVTVAGNPALSPGEITALQKSADPAKAPRTKVVDCAFRVQALINGGHPDKKLALEPRIETPDDHRLAGFRAARAAEKVAILRRWSAHRTLPILAAAAAHAEAKFAGAYAAWGQSLNKLRPVRTCIDVRHTDDGPQPRLLAGAARDDPRPALRRRRAGRSSCRQRRARSRSPAARAGRRHIFSMTARISSAACWESSG